MAGPISRLRAALFGPPVERDAVRVTWPVPPSMGGDMGPPGEWQMRGRTANDETLLSFGAVYSAVQIISGDVAKLPVVFYDIAPDGTQTVNSTYPLNNLMRAPNGYQNRMQFMQAVVISYLTTGNVYILKQYDARNMVRALHVLDPRGCWPYIGDDGSVYYRCAPNALAGLREAAMLPARYIGHIRLQFSAAYPLIGVSPIYAAAASSASGQRILYNAQKFFGNGARPGGVLTAPGKISPETAERLRADWDTNFNAERTGKTAVLGEGLTFTPISMTAVDAQLIEQLRWSVEDVARVFRVPPFMIGDQSKVTYRNSEQLARTYLNGCLAYHLSSITTEFNAMFELGASMTMAFDLDFLLKTEVDLRYDANAKALQSGWKTINEVRRSEGLPVIDYGDQPLVQAQMRTLESVVTGTAEQAGVETQPPPDPETEEPDDATEGEADEETAAFRYCGVWNGGMHKRGDFVTHSGGMWFALRDTTQRPGHAANEVQDWKLAVKSGSPGKTPRLSIDRNGVVHADYGSGERQVIGDLRPLFQEVVTAALRDASTNG